MTPEETRHLQVKLGVRPDGLLGIGSYTALFQKLGAGPVRAAELALGAAVHVPRYGIDETVRRFGHFFAQLAHESGGFQYMEEIASGAAYEGRADLGNDKPGDGKRFKGRGPIQLTGRANYRRFGRLIGIDLESHPEIAAIPSVGMLTACLYWDTHNLNKLADADAVEIITKAINGGVNGLADRKQRLAVMQGLLR